MTNMLRLEKVWSWVLLLECSHFSKDQSQGWDFIQTLSHKSHLKLFPGVHRRRHRHHPTHVNAQRVCPRFLHTSNDFPLCIYVVANLLTLVSPPRDWSCQSFSVLGPSLSYPPLSHNVHLQAFLLYRAHHPRLHPLRDELHKLIESNRYITCAGFLSSSLK